MVMINIKNLICDVTKVPSVWIFEYYLGSRGLTRKLTGQDEMIKSVFNSKDTDPSMSIYVKNGQYKWQDFSEGYGGSKIDLVMKLFNLGFGDACYKIVSDYNEHILAGNGNGITEFRTQAKYKIIDWTRRKWTILDKEYWTAYEIGSKELEHFMVFPLCKYELQRENRKLVVEGKMIYGYFTLAGELYKTYQPMAKERRFMKVMNHVQGLEQLTGKTDICVITKALKDIVSLYNMGIESVAPDSENCRLPPKVLEDLRSKYRLVTLFDADSQGEKSKIMYQVDYKIPGITLPLEKDPSDSVKKHGSVVVKPMLEELIRNTLTELIKLVT